MAGLYPDVPGLRVPYHRDGSIGFRIRPNGQLVELSAASLALMNNEGDDSVGVIGDAGTTLVGLFFPALMDFSGWYNSASNYSNSVGVFERSANTTTGLDGTWTTVVNPWVARDEAVVPNYRTQIVALSLTGVRALRWAWNNDSFDMGAQYYRALHLYGKPTAGEVRYLIFTDTGGVEVTGPYFDFGDDGRGGTPEVKTFKITNVHGTSTANGIVLSTSVLTEKSPVFADDYTFSPDGVTYTATLNIGDLAPGVSSGTLYVKRTTPIGAAVGLEAGMLLAIATSWS